MNYNETNPKNEFIVDLNQLRIYNKDISVLAKLTEGIRQQFLQGSWDITEELLQASKKIEQVASSLLYFN